MLTKTHCTIIFSVVYILGIIAYFSSLELVFASILLLLLIFAIQKRLLSNLFGVILFSVFVFAFFYCDFKTSTSDFLQSLAPSNATIEGRVVTIPTGSFDNKTKFYLVSDKISTRDGDYLLNDLKTYVTLADAKVNYSKIDIGDKIVLKGKLRIPQHATNPSQFSYADYLRNFNTFTTFYVDEGNWKITSKPQKGWWHFVQSLNILRQNILTTHAESIKSPNLEVLGGIVFGDDAISPPSDIKDSFRNSGLLHILAASGLNVGIIFGIWFFLSQLFKIPYRIGILAGMGLIVLYTFMTGFGPPVLRASLMLLFALVGKLIDRDADNVALLFFVAFLLLLYNPAMLFDVGFELSFIVTLGLLVGCPILAEKTKNIPQIFAGAIYLPILAQLMVAPIQVYYFNTFATYSVLANIASIPFVTVISALGFGSSILAMVPKFPHIIIGFCDWALNPFITALVSISKWFSDLPDALLSVPVPTLFQIILYYALLGIVFFILKNGVTKRNLTFLFSLVLVLGITFVKIPNTNAEVVFFDVGNADCILIKSPSQKYFIIDTGKSPYNQGFSQANAILYEYLRDRGIKDIEELIVTHYDADHAGGTVDLLKKFNVQQVVLNPNFDNTNLYKKINDYISANPVNVSTAVNDVFIYTESNFSIMTFVPNLKSKNSDNENSIITILSFGDEDVLFMGDAGVEGFSAIKLYLPHDVEVLKVGHHGADGTVSDGMLDYLGVKTAIISTGYNTYGHPGFSTIRSLKNKNINIARTDADNAIKLDISKWTLDVSGYDLKSEKWVKKLF